MTVFCLTDLALVVMIEVEVEIAETNMDLAVVVKVDSRFVVVGIAEVVVVEG